MDVENNTNNNFLNSLRHVKPENLHMNIFTKELSNQASAFTTNNARKIGKACGKALDELHHLEPPAREKFLQEHSEKIAKIIEGVDSKIDEKVDKIKSNRLLNTMGLANKAGEIYKRWRSPIIVPPDLAVSDVPKLNDME